MNTQFLSATLANYDYNATLVQKFANEVSFRKSEASANAIKTVERNVPILLDLFKQIKPLLVKAVPLENAIINLKTELKIIKEEIKVSKVDSSISSGQIAIVTL